MKPWSQHYHRLRFFAVDAWDEWRHSPAVNLLALATLTAALFLAGLMMLCLGNVERSVEVMQGDVRLEVYLDDDISENRRAALQDELRTIEGVSRVDYVDKAQALERYRAWAGQTAGLIGELEHNPLPASFEVFLDSGKQGAEALGVRIAGEFGGREGVEDVRFDRDLVQRIESLLGVARVGGTALALVVFCAVVFVMASVLRLAVYARRDEIDIMLLVGATPAFVRGSFLVAGLAQGIISSLAALLLIEIARRVTLSHAGGAQALLNLVAAGPVAAADAWILIATGVTVSLAGSFFAVRRSREGEPV